MENSFQIGFALFFGGSLLGLATCAWSTMSAIQGFRGRVRMHRLPEVAESVWNTEMSTAQ